MKRSEVEGKLNEFKIGAKRKIEAQPIPAFFVGVVIGVVGASYQQLIVPLIIVAAVLAGAMWLLGEVDQTKSKAEQPELRDSESEKSAGSNSSGISADSGAAPSE